ETPTDESSEAEPKSEEDESSDAGDSPLNSTGELAAAVRPVANFSVVDGIEQIALVQDEESQDEEDAASDDAAASETESEDAPSAEDSAPPSEDSAPPSDSTVPEESESKPAASEPKYRPLDDDLKSEIRNEIHRRRLRELVDSKMEAARSFMSDLAEQFKFPEDENKKLSKSDVADRLKEYAQKNGLTYGEVPLASFQELEDVDKYPIGSAEEPNDNPLSFQERMNVRVQFFQAGPDELYSVFLANDPLTDVSYATWKTGELPSHVPTLDDAGVRDQVLAAWKIEKARPLAEKRAQELVETLKTSPLPWSEALAETTVTGDDEGLQLTVQTTESFSWMRTTSAPSNNMFSLPEPELSTISTVEKAGDEFMKSVFNELKPREVGAVPNADRSIYYVVKVRNRFPSTPEETAALRESFMRDGQDFIAFFPYHKLAEYDQQRDYAEWFQKLEEKYEVLWRQPEPGETDETKDE
ncbi:MAG: hypothetical protein WD065_13365, partial [Planctomycetaceae bacterium]